MLIIPFVAFQSNINCNNPTGLVSVGANGGTGGFTYIWSTGAQGPTVNLPAGNSTVSVTDANGCEAELNVTITEDITSPQISAGSDALLTCLVSSVTLNGTASDCPDCSFEWSDGSNTISQQANVDVNEPGTYILMVTNTDNGCTSMDEVVVSQDIATPAIQLDDEAELTCGINTLIIDANLPVNNDIEYSWSTNDGNIISDDSSPSVTIEGPGTYQLQVTNLVNGCSSTSEILVTETPVLSLSESSTDALCNGEANGSIDLLVTNGNPPYSFAWSNGANSEDITGLSAGLYTVTVTDADGCTDTSETTISQPPGLDIDLVVTDETTANANDGTATANVSGGTAPYTYLWVTNETSQSIQNLAPGSYSVTVTDQNGCIIEQSFQVNSINCSGLMIDSEVINATCIGGMDGSISLNVIGAVEPITYNWSTDATTSTISNLSAGGYSVSIFDANNCPLEASFTIEAIDEEAPIIVTQELTIYLDEDGMASISVEQIDNGTTDNCAIATQGLSASSFNCSNLGINTIQYTATDTNNNTSSADVEVTVLDTIPPQVETSITDIIVEGCSQAISYEIPDATDNCGFVTSSQIEGLESGATFPVGITTVTYQFMDEAGNETLWSIDIEVIDNFRVQATANDIRCNGETNGFVQIDITGGQEPYSVVSDNENFGLGSDLAAGSYAIMVQDANGCQFDTLLTINEPAPISVEVESITPASQEGMDGAIDVTINGGTQPYFTTLWFNNGVPVGIFEDLENVGSGEYVLEIVDANNCLHLDTFQVDVINSIIDPVLQQQILVYPVPVQDELTVQFEDLEATALVKLTLLAPLGQIIQQQNLQQIHAKQTERLSMNGLANGIYWLRIQMGDRMAIKRIIVAR